MSTARVLPHSLDAEASLLGGIVLRNDVLTSLDDLEPEHFYDPKHQAVFTAMRALEKMSLPQPDNIVEAAHAVCYR